MMMNNGRKRNRDADDPAELEEEEVEDDGIRRKVVKVISAVVIIFKIFLAMQQRDSIQPIFMSPILADLVEMFQSEEYDDEIFIPAKKFQQDLWARIIAIEEYCVDPTRKSEQSFWDTYQGREEDWYKEYRMGQSTFNVIVRNCTS
jgi:hypothetical protein